MIPADCDRVDADDRTGNCKKNRATTRLPTFPRVQLD